MNFIVKQFKDLTIYELYDLLKIRSEIFVVEQNCAYQDLDDKDQEAFHVMAFSNNKLCGYTRLLDKGISYGEYCSIGRVVIGKEFRKKGLGSQIMIASISECKKLFNNTDIKISAQYHLIHFYNTFGFVAVGDQYLEDDIPHIAMVLKIIKN